MKIKILTISADDNAENTLNEYLEKNPGYDLFQVVGPLIASHPLTRKPMPVHQVFFKKKENELCLVSKN